MGGAGAVGKSSPQRVYGAHAVRGVLNHRPDAILCAVLLDQASGKRLADLSAELRKCGVAITQATRAELDRLCAGGKHQGVMLEIRHAQEFSLPDFEALVLRRGRELRVLVLDQVEDPRNLGACLRTADAAGIDALVVPKARAAKLTATALKAAAGAAEAVPVLRAPNLARTLAWLKQAGVWLVGADGEAEQSLHAAALEPPIGIVLGGEGRGLRRLTRESCDELVAIPMQGGVESLNVSVAAGVILYELLRQSPRHL